MRIRYAPGLAVLLAAGCIATREGEQLDLSGQTVELTILHTADVHSRLLPYDLAPNKPDKDLGLLQEAPPYGGIARLSALIKRERAKAYRVLHLDSGDVYQGAPVFNVFDGEAEMKWLSLIKADAVAVGNHEFDKGARPLAQKYAAFGTFPWLLANYIWDDPQAPMGIELYRQTTPYTVLNQHGLRIGVIGMGSISSMNSLPEGGNSLGATPMEQNEVLRTYIELLRPSVDLIVVLSHLGLYEDQDIATGYETYYRYDRVAPFLHRAKAPWKQVDPPEEGRTYPDGTVRVMIPGVSGIDVIIGGHLHIVLSPPQLLDDPDPVLRAQGRKVVLQHSGAFAKFLGRLDLMVQMPRKEDPPERRMQGAEVVSHSYRVFPVDSVWCDDEARNWRLTAPYGTFAQQLRKRPATHTAPDGSTQACRDALWFAIKADAPFAGRADECIARYDAAQWDFDCDRHLPVGCMSRIERCRLQEDVATTRMLEPYIQGLDTRLALTRVFAFAPRDIQRRNSATGGDSPLGNLTAESMRARRRVEAEVALTNSLGIRDSLYMGPVNIESMFNVFPFENTINIMYLSGREMQELLDFSAEKSADRGCQSQVQVAGIEFTMDCFQAQLNRLRYPCADLDAAGQPVNHDAARCDTYVNRSGREHPWECLPEGVCWAHPSFGVSINGKPLVPSYTYKIAVNDYIAKGGSGFKVLKRNTTRIETGISLRDSLIDYMRGLCTCEEILAAGPDLDKRSASGVRCAQGFDGTQRVIDPQIVDFCTHARDNPEKVFTGKCSCKDVLARDSNACGPVTPEVMAFCSQPARYAIAAAQEDGRISRRVK